YDKALPGRPPWSAACVRSGPLGAPAFLPGFWHNGPLKPRSRARRHQSPPGCVTPQSFPSTGSLNTAFEQMSIFQTGQNVWHAERAGRAAVLIDAAAYFGAVREALKKAQRTVFIIGWDINSRIPLVGPEAKAVDGYP